MTTFRSLTPLRTVTPSVVALAALAAGCTPAAPPSSIASTLQAPVPVADAPAVKDPDPMQTFRDCVNKLGKKGTTVVDALACLPKGCTVSLTMSDLSAQPACYVSNPNPPVKKGDVVCQLPRVILTCPNGFVPSFSLCATSPKDSNRVEMCADASAASGEMGDLHLDPAVNAVPPFIGKPGVLSTAGDDKKCNRCHDEDGKTGRGGIRSKPIPITGNENFDVADKVICSNDPGIKGKVNPKEPAFAQCLADICKCIDTQIKGGQKDLNTPQGKLMLALCNGLQKYETDNPPGGGGGGGDGGGDGGGGGHDDGGGGGGTDGGSTPDLGEAPAPDAAVEIADLDAVPVEVAGL